jgi:glycosyltransferase involved in cell wall biosynthesis
VAASVEVQNGRMIDVETDPASQDLRSCELSIVMPCLNEAESIRTCIEKARAFLEGAGIEGEVVVADNGSNDGSQEIARSLNARVIAIPNKGYGNALMGGMAASRGKYIIIGDADDSYDFSALGPFVDALRGGAELVMGNRFMGGIAPGAMRPLHRYLGNPVLTGVGRLFFRSPVGDFHCGLRGFDKAAIERLDLQTTGMEFASEMVVKATLHKLRIVQVPTTLSPDGRSRPPHLRSWHDGWRHLRFLLIYSPRWLFLYPGLALMLCGFLAMLWLLPGPRTVAGFGFDVDTLLYAAAAAIVGLQCFTFAVFTKIFGMNLRLLPLDKRLASLMRVFTLERGLLVGCLMIGLGVAGSIYALSSWGAARFGALDPSMILRLTIPSVTLLAMGLHVVFASFFASVLLLSHRER